MEAKLCTSCGQSLPLERFSKSTRHADGLFTSCHACYAKQRAAYRRTKSPNWYRMKNLKKLYGLTIEDFDDMLVEQKGACRVCAGPSLGRGVYHVDHDHETGRIRGLLCHKCNVALGMVRDSTDHLKALITYLELTA